MQQSSCVADARTRQRTNHNIARLIQALFLLDLVEQQAEHKHGHGKVESADDAQPCKDLFAVVKHRNFRQAVGGQAEAKQRAARSWTGKGLILSDSQTPMRTSWSMLSSVFMRETWLQVVS